MAAANTIQKSHERGLSVQVTVNATVRGDDGQYSSSGLNYGHSSEFKGVTFENLDRLVEALGAAVADIEEEFL